MLLRIIFRLVCEVTYSSGVSFRKFFKFQVLKPLDVKTKFYTAEVKTSRFKLVKFDFGIITHSFWQSDEVYLEAQIQNITAGPICLEKVSLESSEYFSGSIPNFSSRLRNEFAINRKLLRSFRFEYGEKYVVFGVRRH